jgi:DNA-binding transcriptional ArsR family regulator
LRYLTISRRRKEHPYLSEIAADLGLAKSTTMRYLTDLADDGKVIREQMNIRNSKKTVFSISRDGEREVIKEAHEWASLLPSGPFEELLQDVMLFPNKYLDKAQRNSGLAVDISKIVARYEDHVLSKYGNKLTAITQVAESVGLRAEPVGKDDTYTYDHFRIVSPDSPNVLVRLVA